MHASAKVNALRIKVTKSVAPGNLIKTIIELKKLIELEGHSYDVACLLVLNMYN